MPSELCQEELETLMAIFLDEIEIVHDDEGNVMVKMILFPSTGDDSDSKYVTFTLEVFLTNEYPDVMPLIKFRNPRGLSEEKLNTLSDQMHKKCQEIQGCSMIFELIDMGKEFLTSSNLPASECPICLSGFTKLDVFFVPSCFHHVHSFCLGKYLYSVRQSWDNEDHLPNETVCKNSCPVCRLEFVEEIDIDQFLSAEPPIEENEEISEEPLASQTWYKEYWLDKKENFDRLFAKQKEKGGIIDLSGRDIKLLVISSPAPPAENATGESASNALDESTTVSSQAQCGDYLPNSKNPKAKSQQQQQQGSKSSNPTTSTAKSSNFSNSRGSHYRHRRRKQ